VLTATLRRRGRQLAAAPLSPADKARAERLLGEETPP
jgi:hypothetical protein